MDTQRGDMMEFHNRWETPFNEGDILLMLPIDDEPIQEVRFIRYSHTNGSFALVEKEDGWIGEIPTFGVVVKQSE